MLKKSPYYSHTVLYHVALRPPSRVAQSAVIGQHAHSVAIGRFALVSANSRHREVVNIEGYREARLLHISTAHCMQTLPLARTSIILD